MNMKSLTTNNFAIPRRTQVMSDYLHDRLIRCSVCRLKYDLSELKRTTSGQYVCKFCTLQKEVEND